MFHQKVIPKSQKNSKSPYIIHDPHISDHKTKDWSNCKFIRIISIDPGTKHLAIRIEKRILNKNLVESEKSNGHNVITEYMHIFNLSSYTEDELKVSRLLGAIYTALDSLNSYFNQLHIVIVEKQMPQNQKMVRMATAIHMYFACKLRDSPLLPLIIELDPKVKTRFLLAPSDIKGHYSKTKAWGIKKALEILKVRGDTNTIDMITNCKGVNKKDDLADTIIQSEAFCIMMGLPAVDPNKILSEGDKFLEISASDIEIDTDGKIFLKNIKLEDFLNGLKILKKKT